MYIVRYVIFYENMEEFLLYYWAVIIIKELMHAFQIKNNSFEAEILMDLHFFNPPSNGSR